MSSLFISDLHLKADAPELIALAQSFLENIAPQYDDLFILGDFVEYWLGDDAYDGSLDNIFNVIRELKQKNTTVHMMYGNRDFLFGEQYSNDLQINLITADHYVFEQDGERLLLMHGDTLCTNDTAYQQLRKMLRNPQWQTDFLKLPVTERIKAAMNLRDASRSETQEKSIDIMDVNQEMVVSIMQEHSVRKIIHGHTHRPGMHPFEIDQQSCQRFVLGDWNPDAGAVVASMHKNTSIKLFSWPDVNLV